MDEIYLLYVLIITSPFLIAQHVGLYKLFEKAGVSGWKGLIPIYGWYEVIKLIGRPAWWFGLLFLPVIGFIIQVGIYVDMLRCFGKSGLKDYTLGLVFSFIYLPYIGFSSDVKYQGTLDELPDLKKSTAREWTEAIAFAVFVELLLFVDVLEQP